ncbi:SGNH/GDSL hydrolase family protein [Mucilaginibacter xinganensis]|uniref:GDSL family lipase n=1 Tax=Mucilaginibacter xinganensis TaxID=1234841 RepID=A0A223P3W9_9SPHI|nr:SGNH/GDSL hydrolase family protein [Mucilaginibacter xinganensis]ASU36730.1 GDSL family lipase [Mucilaginibacter xinganensis]
MKKTGIILLAICLLSSFKPRELTWIAIGDSITYLNNHLDETGNRVSKGYLTGVTEQLPGIHYINQGHNGWTAGNIARQIDSLGLVKADIYSVFLGTNDWWAGRQVGTLNDYKENTGNTTVYGSFRIIIEKLHTLNSTAKIVLITPMQRNDFVYFFDHNNNAYGSYKAKNGQTLEQFANAVDSIGQYEKIPVVDLYHNSALKINKLVNFKRLKDPNTGTYHDYSFPQSTAIPFNAKTDEYPYPEKAVNLTYDGLHPSDKGNAVIAKCLVREFRKFK